MADAPRFAAAPDPEQAEPSQATPPPDAPPAKAGRRRSSRPTTRAGRIAAGEGQGRADKTPKRSVPRQPSLKSRLLPVLQMPALLMASRCQVCSVHMLTQAEATVDAWIELAKADDRVRRALEALTAGSAITNALIATAGYVMPVMAHHGMLPAAIAGPIGGILGAGPLQAPAAGESAGDGAHPHQQAA